MDEDDHRLCLLPSADFIETLQTPTEVRHTQLYAKSVAIDIGSKP